MSSKARTLVQGSMLRVAEFFASAITGLLLMPFIIHMLGDNMYGLWIFVGSFLGYYGLLDFGLLSAVQRFISRSLGAGDPGEENRIINTALYIFSLFGLITLAASVCIAFAVPHLIGGIHDVAIFRRVILILGLSFAFGFPLRVLSGILRAHIRHDLSAIVELLQLVLRTVLTVVFLSRGNGIIALAVITFAVDMIGYLAKYLLVTALFSHIRFSRHLIDRSKIGSLFNYSIYTFIAQVADQLRFNIDNLVIVATVGLSWVTPYSIGARLIKYFGDFITASIGMTMPLFSQYEGAGNYAAIREKYLFLTKISGYLSILVGGILIIFGRAFILRWVGPQYAGSYHIMLILLIPFLFDVIQSPGNGMLFGLSKHKYYTVTNSIEGVANLVLSLVLVRHYGIYGVAVGTAVPMLIMKVLVQPVYTCRVIGLRCRDFYVALLLPVIISSSLVLGVLWLSLRRFIIPDYLILSILMCIILVVFAVTAYLIGFNSREKAYFKNGLLRLDW